MLKTDQHLASWVDTFLAGQDAEQLRPVSAQLIDPLRAYLLDLRTRKRRMNRTLEVHANSLIDFLAWLGNANPAITLQEVWPDHITLYLAEYQVDGRVQGRKSIRAGQKKSIRTMSSKVGILRAFFDWAKSKRLCHANPLNNLQVEWGIREAQPLPEKQVAHLVDAWLHSDVHPRTAATGLLCLVYGLTTGAMVRLPLQAVDLNTMTFHGLQTPIPIPPWLHPPLARYLAWRTTILGERNTDRFLVTQSVHDVSPNICLFPRMLKPYGVTVRQLRTTALAQTVFHGHLKLLTIFGITSKGMSRYQAIARLTQNTRQVTPKPNLW